MAILADPYMLGIILAGTLLGIIVGALPGISGSFDALYRGDGFIAGTVKEKSLPVDAPVIRKVRLHRERDGLPIYETWSDKLGNYRFDKIDEREIYFVVGFDHTGNYRGVIADKLVPETAA